MNFKNEILKVNTVHNNNNYEDIDLSRFSFTHKSYKRSIFSYVKLEKNILKYCAFTGSKFYKCNIMIKKLNNSNLQNCYFDDIDFTSIERIYASTFDNSVFENCKFDNSIFLSCNFTNAIFINCKFNDIQFKSSNFDNCRFENCTFNRLEFNFMNIDYSHFIDCKFENCIMSAFQLPYIYEFKDLISHLNNKIIINKKEYKLLYYRENINLFLDLYLLKNEAFPILNILCLLNDYDKANSLAFEFCNNEIINSNFSQLKKLISLCNYLGLLDYNSRIRLLNYLNNLTEKGYEIKEYYECKKILFDDTTINEIIIDTGLDYNDPVFIELMKNLDEELTKNEKNSFHMIKYSHKSPAILAISFTQIAEIIGVIGGGITIIDFLSKIIYKFYKKLQKNKKNEDINLPKKITITKTYDKNGILKKEVEELFFED